MYRYNLRLLLTLFFFHLPLLCFANVDFMALLVAQQKRIPFEAPFKQVKKLKSLGLELPSEGVLRVTAPGYASWELSKPEFFKVEINPTELRIYSLRGVAPRVLKKTSLGSVKEASWISFLVENPKSVFELFDVKEIATSTFMLIPKQKQKPFESVELKFDSKRRLKELKLQENTEDSLFIIFKLKE